MTRVSRPGFDFRLLHTDAHSAARRAILVTPHGPVDLPAFMPVGTQGTVKGLTIDQLRDTGAQMILGNTYHLALRPGEALMLRVGGLHAFMGWDGPILTDSGGFQLFSLARSTHVTEQGAVFRSHIDGRLFELSPENAMRIQSVLGSDCAMVLDHVVALPAAPEAVREACYRTVRWAERSRRAATRPDQLPLAIIQGGTDLELRRQCARELVAMDFGGYALGGLSVGESPDDMYRVVADVCPVLPADRPRYLMGVGRPQDILEAVRSGVDLFDCVLPTRNGRNALAFTDAGPLRLRNQCHADDLRPLEADCPCPACRHSRAYLRHLFMADEMLGPILLTLHNVTYYQRLMRDVRAAIVSDRFLELYRQKMHGWQTAPRP